MAHGELRGKQREGVVAPCVSLGMRRRTSWARVCFLGKGYAAKESDGEATAVDDRAGGVARHQASRTRVARRRCQGERCWAIPGARERVWSGARRVGQAVADAGGKRRHGEKQRKGMEVMANS